MLITCRVIGDEEKSIKVLNDHRCSRRVNSRLLHCHGIRGPFAELALFAAASSGDELAQVGSRAPRSQYTQGHYKRSFLSSLYTTADSESDEPIRKNKPDTKRCPAESDTLYEADHIPSADLHERKSPLQTERRHRRGHGRVTVFAGPFAELALFAAASSGDELAQ
ncbi:unnamed protein product, partial [Trichogramma brassicae]